LESWLPLESVGQVRVRSRRQRSRPIPCCRPRSETARRSVQGADAHEETVDVRLGGPV